MVLKVERQPGEWSLTVAVVAMAILSPILVARLLGGDTTSAHFEFQPVMTSYSYLCDETRKYDIHLLQQLCQKISASEVETASR